MNIDLGSKVAEYCGEHLHRNIVADPAFIKEGYKTAITNGFLETDNAIRNGNHHFGHFVRWPTLQRDASKNGEYPNRALPAVGYF